MEVYLQKSLGLVTGSAKKSPPPEADALASGSASPRSEEVSSGPSLRLSAVKERIQAEPEVDRAKVARLSAEIRNGSYRVDPQRVAEKMLDMEWSLS